MTTRDARVWTEAAMLARASGGGERMNGPQTVLLIDDDRDNVAICSVFLAHFGFHVIVAADVATGVLLACDNRPAVVITELFARTRTGWGVLEALSARPETAGIPVIVLSTRSLPADREAASGAAAFVAKPAYPCQVLDHVRRICQAAA